MVPTRFQTIPTRFQTRVLFRQVFLFHPGMHVRWFVGWLNDREDGRSRRRVRPLRGGPPLQKKASSAASPCIRVLLIRLACLRFVGKRSAAFGPPFRRAKQTRRRPCATPPAGADARHPTTKIAAWRAAKLCGRADLAAAVVAAARLAATRPSGQCCAGLSSSQKEPRTRWQRRLWRPRRAQAVGGPTAAAAVGSASSRPERRRGRERRAHLCAKRGWP